MLTILYIIVNTIILMMIVDCNYEFINGMTILYLTYLDYSQIDVDFANPMQLFKVM